MPRPRLTQTAWCVSLALSAGSALAAPAWDCKRGADGKEWVCTTGKGQPAAPREEPREAEEEARAKPAEAPARPRPAAPPAPAEEEDVPAEQAGRAQPAEAPAPARPPAWEEPPARAERAAPSRSAEEPAPAAPAPTLARPPVEQEPPTRAGRAAPPPAEEPAPAPARPAEESARPAQLPAPAVPAVRAEPPARPAPPAVAAAKPSAPPEPRPKVLPAGEAPGSAAQAPAKNGWNCKPGAGKEWDCALTGADPRGEPHVVGEPGKATVNWAHSPDMTREDEQRFSLILSKMPANPWAISCGRRGKREWTAGTDFLMTEADRALRESSPLEIQSERAELLGGEASNFQGAAELARADQKLYGNFVTHNKESGALNAQGNVVYREKGLAFSSDTAFMDLGSDRGVLRNSQFILETVPARGTARVTHLDSKTKTRYETATYTACPPGNQDWLIHAENASIDKEAGEGTATDAWVEFKGVPFLWTPYMSFPVDDRRKDGFLSPTIGYSKQNGFDFMLPYYFNLAPNYDLTLMPRVLSERGELLRGDFRYLTSTSNGRAFADILPWDRKEQETRGQLGWIDDSRFDEHISSHVDLHLVSDRRYIYELGGLLAINNSAFLRSWGTVKYDGGSLLGGSYSASILADYYQSLDTTVNDYDYPYRRMPQVTFNYYRDVAETGLKFQNSAEIARFDQNKEVSGERLNLRPRFYYPFQAAWGYATPSLALQHTEYWLDNLNHVNLPAGTVLPTPVVVREDSTFSRTAPIFSLDSGMYLEREFELFSSPMQQTLEPRLFYLYVPKVSQPYQYNYGLRSDGTLGYRGLNFDSNEYDFNFYQLFRENRFAGVDRLSDANNITPALTSRFISQNSGLEKLKLSVGKVFYLSAPEVRMTPNGPQTTNKHDIVGEMASAISEHWSLRGTGQWNYNRDRVDRGQVALQYNNYANSLLNVSYRYRRDPYAGSVPPLPVNPYNPRTVNQTDISTRLPLGAGWYAIGRWQYDLASQVTVETMAGVERETCCWRFSLIGLRYINGTTGQVVTSDNVTANNAVFFQLELKGLGRFGDQIDNLLLQNFSGYRTDYDASGANP